VTYGKKTLANGAAMYDYSALQPEVAESWEVAADGMSVTFKLRKNATFHDGSPVTAHDVKWSFDRTESIGGFPTFQMKAGSLEKPEQFSPPGARMVMPSSAWRRSSRVLDHAESRRRTYTGQRFHGMLLGMIRARQETPSRHHRHGTAAIPL
jgi:hypothetical protein